MMAMTTNRSHTELPDDSSDNKQADDDELSNYSEVTPLCVSDTY